jgi:hypothetical protein
VAGPYSIDHSHPLANGLNLKNTIWTLRRGAVPLRGYPLVLAGDEPLISIDISRIRAPMVMVNFIPKGSTLQHTANWPILFCNIVDWALGKRPGLKRRNFKCGEKVVFTLPKEVKTVLLADPYGGKMKFAASSSKIFLPSDHPGKYTVSAGGRAFEYTTRSVNSDESDLSKLDTRRFVDESDEETLDEEFADISWAAILAALALLFIHGWMIAKRKGRVNQP